MAATHTPGAWRKEPIIGEPGLFNVYACEVRHGGKHWRVAADLTEGNAALVEQAPNILAERDALRAQLLEAKAALEALARSAELSGLAGKHGPLRVARAVLAKLNGGAYMPDIQEIIPHVWDLTHCGPGELRLIAAATCDNPEAQAMMVTALELLLDACRSVR